MTILSTPPPCPVFCFCKGSPVAHAEFLRPLTYLVQYISGLAVEFDMQHQKKAVIGSSFGNAVARRRGEMD